MAIDPKKGSVCHKMLVCGHIFCLQCLQDFYEDAIKEGRLDTVRCLMPDCAKERAKAASSSSSSGKQAPQSSISLSPSELLQIGLSEDMVKRYVTLKYKTELEADKSTIYCPRQWCNGAARSKKHKKPKGLELHESHVPGPSAAADEQGAGTESSDKKKFNRADLLSVCEDCNFAFCSSCFQSWHGEFVICRPKQSNGELSEEEKASLEYINLHTSPCPTCNAPAQKTHGCNHMICSRCNTHFCYLCSAWLDPSNPYRHYNAQGGGKVTSCYMRLWELEEGDGDDVGLGFGGGRRPPPAAINPAEMAEAQQLDEMFAGDAVDDGNQRNLRRGNENRRLDRDGQHVAVAREAPLVLRLMDENPPPREVERRNQAAAAAGWPALPQQQRLAQHQPPAAVGRGQINAAPFRGAGANRGIAPGARGARGGARGGRGAQNQGPRHQGHGQGQGRGRGGVAGAANGNGLDPAQQAWVRRFVQMALVDAEDQVEGDSDDENDEHWMIR
jgi:E3 ubiquitin-protein ligase RNF14